MKNDKKGYGTVGLMILTVIIIFCVIAIIVTGFRMIKKKDDAKLAAASDTEYIQNKQDREREEKEEETEEGRNSSEAQDEAASEKESESQNTSNSVQADNDADTDSEQEVTSGTGASGASSEVRGDEDDDKLYLIKGDDKSSNRYEKASHLSYTTTIKYTVQDLALLDSYGLKITRNEIFARHGRIFNDQELQEYFQRQQWYVPQTASNDFDDSCLNEVEKYNVELISTYEQQIGGQ